MQIDTVSSIRLYNTTTEAWRLIHCDNWLCGRHASKSYTRQIRIYTTNYTVHTKFYTCINFKSTKKKIKNNHIKHCFNFSHTDVADNFITCVHLFPSYIIIFILKNYRFSITRLINQSKRYSNKKIIKTHIAPSAWLSC